MIIINEYTVNKGTRWFLFQALYNFSTQKIAMSSCAHNPIPT